MPVQEIHALCERFVTQLSPSKVYLFGSFADGTAHSGSDLDFYIVVKDEGKNIADLTAQAYRAVRGVKQRPIDILVGTESRFASRQTLPTIEREVARNGVLLYG
ncbi:MAG: nucleotidyltransferase domain-containing protein [Oscillospiraceae bacterium]|nr:nucleotidyltransferase domain-containing protein [Oscillospiraceae bacterium]MBR3861684.1 nucleotidyltransferase domain-containing protein [Oscillospiraceae bacterium]MBR6096109.1 nucleotidyltransferase domain-containing protein [Oscillospiraceae bacterium]